MNSVRVLWAVVLGGAMGIAAGGCGGSGEEVVEAKGRVTDAGNVLQVEGRDIGVGYVRVEFYRIGDDGQQATESEGCVVDENGNFSLRGATGNGIPPGKYRIAVRQWDPFPDVDRLEGRFDAENSPIIREVTGQEDIVIDVSKPEG